MGLAARLADAMAADYSAIGEIGVQALQSVVTAHRGRVA